MALLFWTASDTASVAKTFGASLKSFGANKPENHFFDIGVNEKLPYVGPKDVLIASGMRALLLLREAGIVAKNRTLESLRETPVKVSDGWLMLTYDPYVIQSQPEKREVIDWDVRLAHRLMTRGTLDPVVGDYQWVTSFAPLILEIEAMFEKTGKPVKLSFDTETMGLYPWYEDKDFVSCSFTHKPGSAHMLYMGPQAAPVPIEHPTPLLDQIKWLLTSPKVRLRMANGKYDLIWVKEKWGIDCTNFSFDTLLVGSLLNENRTNSLNLHAKLMTDFGGYDDGFNAKYDKGHMELVPTEPLRNYQGGDTDAAYQVADVLQAELSDDFELSRFYITILHPAARAFEKVERRGVLVDQQKYHVLADDLRKVIKEGQQKQLSLLPGAMRIKYRNRIDDQLKEGKNPLLPSILNEFFFTPHGLNLKPQLLTPKDKKPSLAKAHLKAVGEGHPAAKAFIEAMVETDSAAKTLSTFVEGFLRYLRPDGRLHPGYMLFHGGFGDDEDDESGTVSGRLSAKEPAFQTLPKKTKWAKRLRECYPAPPGKVLLVPDYVQGELKVVACVAPEPTMIESYRNGLDLHAVTGARLGKVDLKEFLTWKDNEDKALAELFDKHRGNAKPANFGLLYGMQVNGFINYSWANYGIKLTYEEAKQMRDAFFELYPGLTGFHTRQKNLVNLHEEVRSPLGRIRHLPTIRSRDQEVRSKAERQAINSPIQSCLADMMEWAIALIDAAFPNEEVQVVGNIHDAIVAYMDEDKVDALVPQVVDIMSNLPFDQVGWKPQLKFTVDAEVGLDLAHMKKWKKAA